MSVWEIITKETVKAAFGLVTKRFSGDISAPDNTWGYVEDHIKYCSQWCAESQFLGLGQPKDVNSFSIEQNFSIGLRRHQLGKTSLVSETELLTEMRRAVILGAPGAGKTTLAKRAISRLLHQEPQNAEDTSNFPLLIVIRRMSRQSIIEEIATILGVGIEFKDVPYIDTDGAKQLRSIAFSGSKELVEVVSVLIDELGCQVIVDGLDEAHPALRRILNDDLYELHLRSNRAKILVTCRLGDYERALEGFTALEVLPLNKAQIHSIVANWLDSPDEFVQELECRPYKDLASRPLLLTQLILLYQYRDELPDRPADVYEQTTSLQMEKWDLERGILRKSKYSGLNAGRKLQLISEFAFFLFYERSLKISFGALDILDFYNSISTKYGLPADEGRNVAAEIETHSGIICEVSLGVFEFSHLSMQEYFAAQFFIRSQDLDLIQEMVVKNAKPLAVAVALSASPNLLFTTIIGVKPLAGPAGLSSPLDLYSFLDRINRERPFFIPEYDFGMIVLCIMSHTNNLRFPDTSRQALANSILEEFLALPGVHKSIVNASSLMDRSHHSTGMTFLKRGTKKKSIKTLRGRFYLPDEFVITESQIALLDDNK